MIYRRLSLTKDWSRPMQSLDLFNKPTQIYSSLKFNLKGTGIKFLQLLKKKGHKHLGEGSKPKKFIQNNRVNS